MNKKLRTFVAGISFIGLLAISITLIILSSLQITPAYQIIPIIAGIVTVIISFLQIKPFQNQMEFLTLKINMIISFCTKLIAEFLEIPVTFKPSKRTYLKLMVALLLSVQIFLIIYIFSLSIPRINTNVQVIQEPDGQSIGVSDGQFVFDTSSDIGKPEPLIYRENQRISNSSHITIGVVITDPQADRDLLQGAYVAQKETNDKCLLLACMRIRLLVINSGKDSSYATSIAQQIIQIAQQDPTFVGVIGWPLSTPSAISGIKKLTQNNVPVISSSASSNALNAISPYFFRVIPPESEQGTSAANFALEQLHARRVAIFYDPTSPYSQGLALAFANAFLTGQSYKSHITLEPYSITLESYPSYDFGALERDLNNILATKNPDLIYCACYSADQERLLRLLSDSLLIWGQTPIVFMGSDVTYKLPDKEPHTFSDELLHIYFTALAYPDEWNSLAPNSTQTPSLFNDYRRFFDPSNKYPDAYGYARADQSTILGYDALNVFVEGYRRLGVQYEPITPMQLQKSLATISADAPYQGASGQIAFGLDGNPVNKIILMLYLEQGHIKLIKTQGQFLIK